jgi:sulfatase maturation enzyme AslB (radical SAM superfamily)
MRFDPSGKLALHPQFSAYMRGEHVYPINVEISPCGICQASCEFCFYANTGELGSHRNVMLEYSVVKTLIADCYHMGVKSITWTGGGEPSLCPAIEEMVKWVRLLDLEQGMFTNALAMPQYDPSLLSWIRVTMTDKPYKPDCIKPLRAAKTLGFAFNYAGTQDDDYLRETLALAESVKADYVQVRPALAFHGQTVNITPPAIEHPLLQVTEYKFEDAKKPHGYSTCEGYHFVPFIWENGDVDVCAYMRKHEGYRLGNIYKDSLKDILDRAPHSVPVHTNCQVCCKNHEINKAVHHARQIQDRNFP